MLRVLVVGACLLLPAIALGQAKTQAFVFDPDLIEAKLPPVQVERIDEHTRPEFRSILQVRKNFNEKVVHSASEL
jgi:hypothetical protein